MILALVAAVSFIGLQRTQVWQHLETQALDQRFQLRGPRAAPDEIVIVTIDDESIAELGGWPIRRDLLSAAIDRLNKAGVNVIGIDLLLLPQHGANAREQESRVAESLEQARYAVLAAALPRLDIAVGRTTHQVKGAGTLMRPSAKLAASSVLGHVNVLLDSDGRLRRLLPAVTYDGERLPALPLAMYQGLVAQQGRTAVPRNKPLWLDYYGAEGTFRTIPIADLVQDRAKTEDLRGRAVMIGATATGLGDAYATPLSPRLPGVEYFATALGNMIDGSMIRRDESVVAKDAGIVALAALLAALAAQWLTPAAAALVTTAMAAGVLLVQQYAFATYGIWFSTVGPPLAMAAALTASFGARLLSERSRRRHSESRVSNLRRYVAPALADALADQAKPVFSDRLQTAAVLFIDIASFTGISEAIGPQRTASLLRNFHRTVEDVVNAHGGVLTSFLGDGAMAVFGLPSPNDKDSVHALAAARELANAFAHWSPMRIGIGLHAGPVAIAQLGGREQMQITATGDTVNLASRLENLSRQHDAAITLSEDVLNAVRENGEEALLDGLVPLGAAYVRGRRAAVQAWILPARHDGRTAA